MPTPDFTNDLSELVSAEDFLDYFGITYDPEVVHINRLHILQRFHNYLRGAESPEPEFATWRSLLTRAYDDFVHSDALTEGVFEVFKRSRGISTIPVSAIGRRHT